MVSLNFIKTPITKVVRPIYNSVPSLTILKNGAVNKIEHIGRKWTSPQQRLIMGATALLMQPAIDYYNKNVDDKTREVSVAKTVAKICVGTATGFAVRHLCIKAMSNFSKLPAELKSDIKPISKKIKTFLTPTEIDANDKDAVMHYRNAMGTLVSLFIMLFTNFAIDAPFTNYGTNLLVKLRSHFKKGDS